MMPDLGKYAATILMAYGISIALLGGLVVTSLLRAARLRRTLDRAEADIRKQRQ